MPDSPGLTFWTGQIRQCITNVQCFETHTIAVSNQYFAGLEYQQTGTYAYRLLRAAFGNSQPCPNPDTSNTTEANKIPCYDVYAGLRAPLVGSSNLAADLQTAAHWVV